MFSKPVIFFLLLTFLISWSIFFCAVLMGAFETPITAGITAFVFMWGPAISALICAKIFDKGRIVETLGLKPKFNIWLVIAWGLPIVLCVTAAALSLLGPDIHLISVRQGYESSGLELGDKSPKYLGLIVAGSAVTLGAAINGLLLISEELGWRGYLWSKLIEFGFWKTSFITGIFWGFWHAPLIYMGHNYPGMPIVGIFIMVAFTTLLSPVIGFVRLKNDSMWAASLFHGTLNAVAGVTLIVLANAKFPWNGIIGMPGLLVLMGSCFFIYLLGFKKPNKS